MPVLGRGVVAPHVVVAIGRRAIGARRAKPRVLVGGVVDHEVDDHAQAAIARVADGVEHVAQVAEPRIDREVVGDVVAVVAVGRRVEGHQPQARGAQARGVIDALDEPGEVAAAVAVGVVELLDVEAVDDGVLPPQVAGRPGAHRTRALSAARRRSAVAPRAAAPAAAPGQRALVRGQPQLRAARLGLVVEAPVRAGVARRRRLQVVVAVGGDDRRVGLLRLDVRAGQVAVHQARGELLAEDRVDGRQPDPQLAPGVLGGPRDRARGDLGLVDRRHGLRVAVQIGADPSELRRVEAGQLDERDAHVATCRAAARRAASPGSP